MRADGHSRAPSAWPNSPTSRQDRACGEILSCDRSGEQDGSYAIVDPESACRSGARRRGSTTSHHASRDRRVIVECSPPPLTRRFDTLPQVTSTRRHPCSRCCRIHARPRRSQSMSRPPSQTHGCDQPRSAPLRGRTATSPAQKISTARPRQVWPPRRGAGPRRDGPPITGDWLHDEPQRQALDATRKARRAPGRRRRRGRGERAAPPGPRPIVFAAPAARTGPGLPRRTRR